MTEAVRRRETRYTDTVAVRVPSEVKARLEVLAERDGVALGIVLRQVIEAGLPEIEGAGPEHPEQASAEVRAWWGNLPRRERTRWGKRLGELDGAAFLQEAYRQAMTEGGQ